MPKSLLDYQLCCNTFRYTHFTKKHPLELQRATLNRRYSCWSRLDHVATWYEGAANMPAFDLKGLNGHYSIIKVPVYIYGLSYPCKTHFTRAKAGHTLAKTPLPRNKALRTLAKY